MENRTWVPPVSAIGEKLLIHASGKRVPEEDIRLLPFEWCSAMDNAVRYGWLPEVEDMPTGAIIGYVDLVGYSKETQSLWDGGEEFVKWIFENAFLFDEPIPARGKLGVFDTPMDVLPPAHKVMEMLPHRAGDVVVLPYSEKFADEAIDDGMVVLDVPTKTWTFLPSWKGRNTSSAPLRRFCLLCRRERWSFQFWTRIYL